MPDPLSSLEDALTSVNRLYEAKKLVHFGLSNALPEDVEYIYQYFKEHEYVTLEVYQGKYNAVARRPEERLIPTLRRLGMSFYAYGPIAGGFLTKSSLKIRGGTG